MNSVHWTTHLESLLVTREGFGPRLHLVHVLAAVDLVLQRMLLVEMGLLEIFLKPRTEVAAHLREKTQIRKYKSNPTKSCSHLTLQVPRDPAALELDHPEHTAGVALLGVVVQLGDAPHLLK